MNLPESAKIRNTTILSSIVGEPFPTKLLNIFKRLHSSLCTIWNSYGPAETTIACTWHAVNLIEDYKSVPIGLPLPGYRCLILDEFH
ncbi:unnamed protein product, partial [Adineta ricciae]